MPTLPVKKLREDAKLPVAGNAFAIGLDLHALDPAVIEPGERRVVLTGIAAAIPPTHYGRVAPRSGLAVRNGLDVLAGVIDSDYRGDISVVLINHGAAKVTVSKHDRVGQLILERADRFDVEEFAELPETQRGASGFGSTGR